MHADHSAPVFLLLLASAVSGFPQSAPVVTGAGYTLPAPVKVAPGQVLTIFVQGIGSGLTQPVRAPESTLPTSLAGISVTLEQGSDRPVGILDVRPVSTCAPLSAAGTGVFPQPVSNCGRLTAVTVQIPFDIVTICSVCVGTLPSEYAPTVLWVSENGTNSAVFQLMALSDQIHVLTSCDTFLTAVPPPINYTGLPCSPMVTHVERIAGIVRQSGATRRGSCGLCRRPRQHESCSGGRPTGALGGARHHRLQPAVQLRAQRAAVAARRESWAAVRRGYPRIRWFVPDQSGCSRSSSGHTCVRYCGLEPTAAGQQRGAVQSDGEHRRHVFIRRCRDLRGGPTVELPRPGVPATGYEWGSDCTSAGSAALCRFYRMFRPAILRYWFS